MSGAGIDGVRDAPDDRGGAAEGEVRAVRARAGLGLTEVAALAEVSGEDRARFLQTQLPVDVEALAEGAGAYTAYLDRKGRVTADLLVLNAGHALLLVLAPELRAAALATLEHHHIRERVAIRDLTADHAIWELHGPATPAVLARLAAGARLPVEPFRHARLSIAGVPVRWIADPWTGDVGGRLAVPRDHAEIVREAILSVGRPEGLITVSANALEILRIEGGRPRAGLDLDERTLLPELDREGMVSHDKGCYLGQETVARVHARGHVNRVLRGLLIEGRDLPAPGSLLHRDDLPVGETRSAAWSPSLDRVVALAMVRREAAEPGTVVYLRGVPATVSALPLYRPPGPAEQAETFYLRGMEAFKADRFEAAIADFERATFMNPRHGAAFEAVGVCLERLGRLDEAVAIMQALTDADPDNVMAWTNLSRYYALRGHTEDAERVKGRVTALVWKRELGEKAAAKRAGEEDAARRARLEERVPLFERVLEMDPADVIANFGLGKTLLDLGRYNEAAPRFRRALEAQPDYSMAMSHLATCLLRMGRRDEAGTVLREGIEIAGRKGDLVPKREMMRKLEELRS